MDSSWARRDCGVAVAAPVGANHRHNGKAAVHGDDAIPLPVADHFFDPAAGAGGESLSIPKRQLIKEVGAELVCDAVGRNYLAEVQGVPAQDRPRLILVRAGEKA